MNPPANWYPDPTGRHGQRYWDGEQWTEHVFTDGVQGTDPLEGGTATTSEDTSGTATDAVEQAAAEAAAAGGTSWDTGASEGDGGPAPEAAPEDEGTLEETGPTEDHTADVADPGGGFFTGAAASGSTAPAEPAPGDESATEQDEPDDLPDEPEAAPPVADLPTRRRTVPGTTSEPEVLDGADDAWAGADTSSEDDGAQTSTDEVGSSGGITSFAAARATGPADDEPDDEPAVDGVDESAAATGEESQHDGATDAGDAVEALGDGLEPAQASEPAVDLQESDEDWIDEGTAETGEAGADVASVPGAVEQEASAEDAAQEDELTTAATDEDAAEDDGETFSDAFVLAPETASRIMGRRSAPADDGAVAEATPDEGSDAAADDAAADATTTGAIDAPPPSTAPSRSGLGITGDLVSGAFAEREDGGAVTLQNTRLLRCRVTGDAAVVARQGTMVAFQGDVSFERQGAGGVTRALKRAATGEGLAMMRVEGDGDVFFADAAQHVFVLHLDGSGPGLSVNGRNVLAFSAALDWDIERVKGASLLAGGLFNTTLRGTGWVALVSDGEPVVLRTDEAPTRVDVNALVAWSAGLGTSVTSTVSAKSLVGLGSGEAFQMAFDGAGLVVVQPSEGANQGAAAT